MRCAHSRYPCHIGGLHWAAEGLTSFHAKLALPPRVALLAQCIHEPTLVPPAFRVVGGSWLWHPNPARSPDFAYRTRMRPRSQAVSERRPQDHSTPWPSLVCRLIPFGSPDFPHGVISPPPGHPDRVPGNQDC